MVMSSIILFAALTSANAVATLLNSPSSCSDSIYRQAQEIVEREAAEGKPLQQFVIGITTKDKNLAQRYLDASRPKIQQLAANKDNSLAWYLLSMERNDFKLLKHAANGGNVQALNALGTIAIQEAFNSKRLSTNQLEVVLSKAYGYFKRAALQRDANALINLGTCYLRGFGCKINFVLAFECFQAAAKMGHPEGMDYMSASYEKGLGVPRNPELAIFWCMKAKALRGDKPAQEWIRDRKSTLP